MEKPGKQSSAWHCLSASLFAKRPECATGSLERFCGWPKSTIALHRSLKAQDLVRSVKPGMVGFQTTPLLEKCFVLTVKWREDMNAVFRHRFLK
jgi:hypothetical protein